MARSFLDLPPEIRNIIYHYVLGSLHLHISGKRLRARLCGNPISYLRRAKRIKKSSGDGRHISPWSPHYHCRDTKRSRRQRRKLGLGLLLTCRQVHAETAVLPFGQNTFIFDSCLTLKSFLASLTHAQAAAVKDVVLESVAAGDLDPRTMALAKGLEHLLVFGLFFSLDLDCRYNASALRNVLYFHLVPLHTFKVCFEFLSLEGQLCPVDLRSLERKLESLVVDWRAKSRNLVSATPD
jgi:hypothetical protein